jgi:hypothetical protein
MVIFAAATSLGAQTCTGGDRDFGVSYESLTRFPSLVERRVLRVNVPPDLNSDGCQGKWHAHDPASFQVRRSRDGERVPVERVEYFTAKTTLAVQARSKPANDSAWGSFPVAGIDLQMEFLGSCPVLAQEASVLHSGHIWELKSPPTPFADMSAIAAAINQSAKTGAGELIVSAETDDQGTVLVITPRVTCQFTRIAMFRAGDDKELIKERREVPAPRREDPSIAFLTLDESQIRRGDELKVILVAGDAKFAGKSATTVGSLKPYTVGLNPNFVPNQDLRNGKKRNVGQLGVNLDVPLLFPHFRAARSYLNSDSLFSTDAKDKTSKMNLTQGFERSLIKSWFIPIGWENKVQGNQTADNFSFLSSLGLRSILPWGWTSPGLYNELVQAAVSPEFDFAGQYERRLRQDAEFRRTNPRRDLLRIAGQTTWKPIYLLPSKDKAASLALEVTGKGWFIPNDEKANGSTMKRLEGYFEISLLVPITKLNFQAFALAGSSKVLKQRMRIKYAAGANEANGWKHFSQLTIGVEAIK